MVLSALAIPVRAANQSPAGKAEKNMVLWTNEDLEQLRTYAAVSIVGQPTNAHESTSAATPVPYPETRGPQWYAMQAAKLRDELEPRQTQLSQYLQALEDTRSLKETTGGINLDGKDIGITPESGIEILQQRVTETESELEDLEDLARRNGIEPGVLRGQ
jgi:hypothetical protein